MERYKDNRRGLHDLGITYDRVCREVMWWLERKQIYYRCIEVINDMYNGALTNVRIRREY